MTPQLVLSIFPGIGLLDMAFEEEGFCVVRGPDLLWGGDVKRFHPSAGVFDGVIGGDPCQAHSRLEGFCISRGVPAHEDFTPEYERIVREAAPRWFLRENVPLARGIEVAGYSTWRGVVNCRDFGSEQHRERAFWFGVRGAAEPVDLWRWIEIEALRPVKWQRAILASGGRRGEQLRSRKEIREGLRGVGGHPSLEEAIALQGLPAGFLDGSPLTKEGRYRVIGNGVPLPMGRGIAKAVRQAVQRMEVRSGNGHRVDG